MSIVLRSNSLRFLELGLIRWTGENVVELSYFTNLVLLGVGLRFLRANLFPFADLTKGSTAPTALASGSR